MTTKPIDFQLMHHKEATWAEYLYEYSDLSILVQKATATVQFKKLPEQNSSLSFAKLPERVRRLLFFAKPDLIVCMDDGLKPVQPIFALDLTSHVPARDHWIQRFPNLVGCAQEGVPGAFVAPADMPNRPNFPGKTDPFFYFAYDRVVEIHQTPIYIADWPSSDGQNLDSDSRYGDLPPHDSKSMQSTLNFFNLVLDSAIRGRELSSLMRDRLIVDLRNELRQKGYQKIPSIRDFKRLSVNMRQGTPLDKTQLKRWCTSKGISLPTDLPDRIAKRSKNIVVSPVIPNQNPAAQRASLKKRIKDKGGDPYTQQPLVFDYLFCRIGRTPLERDANLVIDLSVLAFSDFADYVKSTWAASPLCKTDFDSIKNNIPIYTLHLSEGLGQVMKNFVRLYAFAADILIFKDGVLYF